MTMAVPAAAQAWLPLRGEGSISLSYQNAFGGDHYDTFGKVINFGPIRSRAASLRIEYGITDRFAVVSEMPYVSSKFTLAPGLIPTAHDLESKVDDGRYRGTFQDFHAGVRFNAIRESLKVTPFFEVVIPAHSYETFGHAAPGRHLREAQTGVYIGRRLTPFLPRAYLDLKSTYSFVQSLDNLNLDHLNGDLEVSYVVNDQILLRGFGSVQKTLGGLEAPVPTSSPFFEIHDRALRTQASHAGAGITFGLSNNIDAYGVYLTTLAAKNAHAFNTLAVGFSWTFRTRRSVNVLH